MAKSVRYKRAPIKTTPSREFLLSILRYEPDTGLLFWNERNGRNWFNSRFANTLAGAIVGKYICVQIKNAHYKLHRIIWKMTYDVDPLYIDHIDGDPTNNRLSNLRSVSHAENMWNTRMRTNNASGFRGVSFIRAHGKWRAAISVEGKKRHLGYFDTAEQAAEAFERESRSLRPLLHGSGTV